MRKFAAFGAVIALALVVSIYGCEKDARTVTVTVNNYFYNVGIDNAAEAIIGYSCYNLGNEGLGPHYGYLSVGCLDTYGGPDGNEMDFGFIAFDFGTLDLPNGAELAELAVYLNNVLAVDNGISIYVTLQDAPTDNTVEMIEKICSGALLCQTVVETKGLIGLQIDPAAVVLHGGKFYLGLYSNAGYCDNKFIFCDPLTSYARVKYTYKE